jgi:hypothetical protein
MKILLILEYPDIEDPNSPGADELVESVSETCAAIAATTGADSCYVQEVYGADENKTEKGAPTC